MIVVENGLKPAECDIVMEGGITSGVVYPAFIARLAGHFRLRSIGGASVGAIAAVAAAAAQFNLNARAHAGLPPAAANPFDKLAGLGKWLQKQTNGKSNLFALFQPCPDLTPHFNCLVAALNAPNWWRGSARVLRTLVWSFPLGAVMGEIALLALHGGSFDTPWARIGGFALAMLGLAIGSAVQFAWSGVRRLRKNRFGICSGLRNSPKGTAALTEWLHDFVQQLAGLPADQPLTFGQLRKSKPPIELVLMTTGVSEFRAHRLPYVDRDLAFRRSELERYFPAAVIAWLVARPAPHKQRSIDILKQLDPQWGTAQQDVYFMPVPDDLPIIVAARMSLSFPILLQAVPLLRIRFYEGAAKAADGVGVKTVWYSDGGLTNNFPIHLFDQLLPSRPTFGVVLDSSLRPGSAKADRVVLAQNNAPPAAGYSDIGNADGSPKLFRFFSAMLETIRTWRHEALKRTPGFCDRVVLIKHTKKEGGLNLNMSAKSIARMSESGRAAADAIVRRFHADKYKENGWINHRFVRMRTAAALLHNALEPVATAMNASAMPTYRALWTATGTKRLGAYRLNGFQQAHGIEFFGRLVYAFNAASAGRFDKGGPKAMPTLTVTPKEK